MRTQRALDRRPGWYMDACVLFLVCALSGCGTPARLAPAPSTGKAVLRRVRFGPDIPGNKRNEGD